MGFEEVEQTADWALRISGRDMSELFVNAALGLNQLFTGSGAIHGRREVWMMESRNLRRIDRYLYEIPQSYRSDMRVPARFYADQSLLTQFIGDKSLAQLVNTTTFPGVLEYALAMPDIHQGYGFPIGGVVATQLPNGAISPGGVGYDINCGVRLLASRLRLDEAAPYLGELASVLYAK